MLDEVSQSKLRVLVSRISLCLDHEHTMGQLERGFKILKVHKELSRCKELQYFNVFGTIVQDLVASSDDCNPVASPSPF